MTNIIKTSTAAKLAVILIDDTDFKGLETGVAYDAAGMTVRYRKPSAETTWSTKTLAANTWTELGHGVYLISFIDTEIGSSEGEFLYYCQATGILPYYGSAYVTSALSSDLDTLIDTVDTVCDGIKTKTDALPDSIWGVTTRTLSDYSGVWSVTTRALTDKIGFSLAADQSAVTMGTVNTLTTWDKTDYSLSTAAIDAILDDVIEGTLTVRQALKLIVGVSAGKSNGGGTATLKFRDTTDTKDRVTATVDENGNRTAVTLDVT